MPSGRSGFQLDLRRVLRPTSYCVSSRRKPSVGRPPECGATFEVHQRQDASAVQQRPPCCSSRSSATRFHIAAGVSDCHKAAVCDGSGHGDSDGDRASWVTTPHSAVCFGRERTHDPYTAPDPRSVWKARRVRRYDPPEAGDRARVAWPRCRSGRRACTASRRPRSRSATRARRTDERPGRTRR
jgi:hypothetical protein